MRWCFLLCKRIKEVATIAVKKELPKKKCPICGKEKNIKNNFYKSTSPLYQEDGCVPICITCVKEQIVNEDGTINKNKLKTMCQRLDKPLYWDDLESAYSQYRTEHSFLSNDEVAKNGKDIIGLFFKNIMMRQTKNKCFADSEKENFLHTNSNTPKAKKMKIAEKYSDNVSKIDVIQEAKKEVEWSQQDIQNMDYAIDIIGYDPFVGYPENDRRFLFNQLAPYLEDDDIADDAYKLSQILQIVDNNKQIRQCDVRIANLDPIKDAESIKTLNSIKKDLVQSNDKIAKENEISVKNRSNKDVGRSTLTYLMRDLRNKNFDKAEADYYDQLRSTGTRWAVDMSMASIVQNGMFDENDKKEIYETQLYLIDKLNQELDECKEKIRLLLLEIDRLKAGGSDE